MNLTQKIIKQHLVEGEMAKGKEIGIKIDQVLTQDATGTMAFLEFEALDMPKIKADLAVSYVDHNMLQTDFKNPDDHIFLQTAAAKFGAYFSKPGNGICHQVHLERFSVPGATLLGSDSHTPTCGGMGSLAIGAGGLDVALALGGGLYYLPMPTIVGIKLTGKLSPWSTAKDVILEMNRRLTVKGGKNKIFEYFGPGVKALSVPERSTITNMGAELGATTSIFPSDEMTLKYLIMQGREKSYKALSSDSENYDELIEVNLSELKPLIAKPHSPDNVVPIDDASVKGTKVQQVIIGSCTNSSFRDLMVAAKMVKGKKVHPNVSFAIVPGSKQVYEQIARNGALADLISSGARILESACGPCIGMGQAPPSGGVSVRSFNRNFRGRCGSVDAGVYLASPEVCVACALKGEIADPRELGAYPEVEFPEKIEIDDSMILSPSSDSSSVEIIKGPNIKSLPPMKPTENSIQKEVLLKVGDNITTDHIMPAGAEILPLRSNIPEISKYVYRIIDKEFPQRALAKSGGIIIGGENYGQGSSREHAAIAPLYLGIKAKIVKSYARIHLANLVNWGILPLEFANHLDYDKIDQGDNLELVEVVSSLKNGENIKVRNLTKNYDFETKYTLSKRDVDTLLAGGSINYVKEKQLQKARA